tara:strand:- start:5413 stop:5784 length:372 start_codon:yes stop_codon:yes gene_type:complete
MNSKSNEEINREEELWELTKVEYFQKIDHAKQNNIDPTYIWYHTQNNNGNRYQCKDYKDFRTRYECLDDIRRFKSELDDGEEEKFKITYVIQHFVLSKFSPTGQFSSGFCMPDEHFLPSDFDN